MPPKGGLRVTTDVLKSLAGSREKPISLLVASIGNPAPYENTRHNAGHDVGRAVFGQSSTLGLGPRTSKQLGEQGTLHTFDHRGITYFESKQYMNISGNAIKRLMKWYKEEGSKRVPEGTIPQLLILHDELDLKLGKVSFKAPTRRGNNGQNGLKSIVEKIPDEFARLRIGISRPDDRSPDVIAQYVLERWTPGEEQTLWETTVPATEAFFQQLISSGILAT